MRPRVLRVQVALAGAALLGGVIAVAASGTRADNRETTSLPAPVVVPGIGWYRALAAPYPRTTRRTHTTCGHKLDGRTRGVAHPTLPCGVKLFIAYGDATVLTQVVDSGPRVPGREFDVTRPLAEDIGLDRTRQIRWRFAR